MAARKTLWVEVQKNFPLRKVRCRLCGNGFKTRLTTQMTCRKCLEYRPLCACGCGTKVRAIGDSGAKNFYKYVKGHQWKGKLRSGQQSVWVGMTEKHKREIFNRISKTVRKSYANGTRKVTSAQKFRHDKGWMRTPWGKMYYDSFWEKEYIKFLKSDKNVVYVERNFPIPYTDKKGEHTFLVDFAVLYLGGRVSLIEIKNKYLLAKQHTKLRAAERYCKQNGFGWVLVTARPNQGRC